MKPWCLTLGKRKKREKGGKQNRVKVDGRGGKWPQKNVKENLEKAQNFPPERKRGARKKCWGK